MVRIATSRFCSCRCLSVAKRRHGTCRTPPGEGGGSKRKGLRAKLFGGTARSVGEPKPVGRMALQRAIGAEPLSEVCLPYARASARKIYWGGRCGKERPAEAGGSG